MSLIRVYFIIVMAWMSSVPLASAADNELIVYSGRSDKFVKPVVEEFTRATGINVVLHNASSTALLNKLRVEGQHTEADLYLSNDAGNLQVGSDLGLFQVIAEEFAGEISSNLRAPDNTWIGLSARARVLVVNTKNKQNDNIKSVFDLANPDLKGRLGITSSSNESFISGVTVYLSTQGREKTKQWLEGLKSNADGEVFAKHSKIVANVASGKKDVGLVNHYYIFRHLDMEPDAPIRIVMPDQGSNAMGVAWNVAGIAISKYTKKPDLAARFVAFLVSDSGQKIFADANREYPAKVGIEASGMVPPVGSFKVAKVPMHELGRQRNATIDLIEAVGMP